MIITLTTDFGATDPYVGLIKGVILGIAPEVSLVDLSHEVPPQDVLAGALVLESVVGVFPEGTIHVAVVDPGVGSRRRPVAIEARDSLWVGPDNGLFTTVLAGPAGLRAVALTDQRFHRHPTSATFHGRDIFAPVAGHLARGVPLTELGDPVTDLVRLDVPQPVRTREGLEIHVLRVDRFGNLITDLSAEAYEGWKGAFSCQQIIVKIADAQIHGIRRTFADVDQGDPVAYFGSTGRLEVAIRNGSAARRFNVQKGAVLKVADR